MGIRPFSLRTALGEEQTDSTSGQAGVESHSREGRANCGLGALPPGAAGRGTCQEDEAGCRRWARRQTGHSTQNGGPGSWSALTQTLTLAPILGVPLRRCSELSVP